jgi:hypothetical protein
MFLAVALIAFAARSQAAVITFTGGTVTRLDTSLETTSNTVSWDNVDYYEEDGFKLDFLPNSATGFSTHVGNYYGAFNDVIHSHWVTGNYGTVTSVEITKVGGGSFDLNYFILTSNTDTGGSFASGFEQAYVRGFDSFNLPTGPAVLLPSENWGFPATQIFLGSDFDTVTTVRFSVTNPVDCFGMDEFYIDEPPPPPYPEPSSFVLGSLLGAGGLATGFYRRRKRTR